MKKNRFFVILSAVLLLAGCKDFTREDKSPAVDNTADSKKAYIYLSTVDFARTLKPDFTTESIANYAVTLSAKKSGETDGTMVASYEKFSELPTSAAPIAIDLGTYIFTLTATDGKNNTLTDTTSAIEIVAGNNPLTFNLKWIEPESFSGAGSFSLTLNIADNVDVTNLISAKGEIYEWDVENAEEGNLYGSANLTITTDSVTQKKSVTYTNDDVEAGVYHVKITLYADNEKTVPLASPYSEIAIITDGQNSNATRTIKALNPVYSINCVADGGTLSDGKNLPSKYTAYTEIMLPNNLEKDNYEFKGWYTNPKFENDAVESIPKGSSGNKTFYAMFVPAGGFVHVSGATVTGAVGSGNSASQVFITDRNVTIGDLYVCDHEVTQAEFQSVMGITQEDLIDSVSEGENKGIGDNYPVYYVNWYMAIAYCNKKSCLEHLECCYSITINDVEIDWENLKFADIPTSYDDYWNSIKCNWTANGYRLPTEVEWEYLARGGKELKETQTDFSGSDDIENVAWYSGNSNEAVHEVKTDKVQGVDSANSLGIYDMCGNVCEWTWDWYSSTISATTPSIGYSPGSSKVYRGGSWSNQDNVSYVSTQYSDQGPENSSQYVGFRVVRNCGEGVPHYVVFFDLTSNWIENPATNVQVGVDGNGKTVQPLEYSEPKNNYPFIGWYSVINPNSNDTPFDFTSTITSDVFIYAVWQSQAAGDVLLKDGTFVPYNSAPSFTNEQKQNAVGIIYDLDENNVPRGIIELNVGTNAYNGFWAETSYMSTGDFSSIVCTPTVYKTTFDNITSYDENEIPALISDFTGCTIGKDNLSVIESAVSSSNLDNFPIFYNTIKNRSFNFSGNYSTGWYIPTIAELCYIYKNKDVINNVLEALGKQPFKDSGDSNGYWSSSPCSEEVDSQSQSAWCISFQNGCISYMRKDTGSYFAFAIHELE